MTDDRRSSDGEIHAVSHKLGELEGVLSGIKEHLSRQDDDGERQTQILHAELRNVKHDYRNIEQKIEAVKYRVQKIENWQAKLAGAWAATVFLGSSLGAFLAWTLPMLFTWAIAKWKSP